jgi:pimeloyl-ACP methyl ester carboxylesterase
VTLQGIRVVSTVAVLVAATAGASVAQEHVVGQAGPGALYALDMPADWNGDLVVYAHGIVDPVLPVALPSAQDNFIAIRDALLSRGFAVASSSFSGNGFILKDAAQRTHQLTGLFTERFSPPRRVLLAGHSLGSIAALKLAETYSGQYDGALVMCGFVDGTTREIEYMATARLIYDFLFPGVIPGSVFSIPEDLDYRPGTPLFNAVQGSLIAGFAPPFKTFQFAAAAGLPGNNPGELVTSALTVLGFNLRYTRNLLQHTNGHIPFDNQDVIYPDAALNLGIQRWVGDADALTYVAQYYTPSGRISVPIQTLHSDRDPVVPAWHEDLYAARVAEQGLSDLLEQTLVSSYGHCAFTPQQVLTAFDRLVERLP